LFFIRLTTNTHTHTHILQAQHFIKSCLASEPKQRLAVRDMHKHAFLSGGFDERQIESTFGTLQRGFQLLEESANKLLGQNEERKNRLKVSDTIIVELKHEIPTTVTLLRFPNFPSIICFFLLGMSFIYQQFKLKKEEEEEMKRKEVQRVEDEQRKEQERQHGQNLWMRAVEDYQVGTNGP
jgi:serine/threonine protein kinase